MDCGSAAATWLRTLQIKRLRGVIDKGSLLSFAVLPHHLTYYSCCYMHLLNHARVETLHITLGSNHITCTKHIRAYITARAGRAAEKGLDISFRITCQNTCCQLLQL